MRDNFKAWLIWGIAVSFYFYEFALQVSPGVLADNLIKNFGISTVALGMFGAAYYYTYASMQVPAGILIDKYGPKKVLTIAISCCLAGVLLFCFAKPFGLLILARAILGFGSAFAMIGTLKLASNWFPETKFAFVAGLTYLIGMSGALAGKVPLDILLNNTSWQTVFILIFMLGLIILTLFLLLVKDSPPHFLQQHKSATPTIKDFLGIIKFPQPWLIAIYSGLMVTGFLSLGALWGEQYLMQVHTQSKREAALLISLIFMGYAIGSPFVGRFSDKIGRRKLPLTIGALCAIFFYTCLIYWPSHNNLLFAFFAFCFGVSNAFAIIVFPLSKEICHENVAATAIAFTNFITMSIGALGEFMIGVILKLIWSGQYIDNVPIHSPSEFHLAFLLFVFTYIIAFIISLFIKETYSEQRI